VVSEPVQVNSDTEFVEVIIGSGDERRIAFVSERNSVRIGK